MALQHLRSSTADKRPTPAAMSDGQLAMNTNLASPGLFLKDSNGALVKVGPVHVGTTAPNATPASGGQAGNSVGEQWLDTSSSRYVFKIWDGTDWRTEDGEFVNISGDTMTGALGIIAGTNTAPGVFFSGDTNTGIYSPGADQVAVATNGVERVTVDTAATTSTLPVVHPLGTAAAPSIAFTGDTNTGIYSPGADQLALTTGGVERVNFNAATEVVFNDGGADVDFRIEGDTNPNLFKIDAGTDQVQVANLNGGPLAGFRNAIINGNFDIWQRGTSFTGTEYGADRWFHLQSGTTHAVTRQAFALGQTDVPGEPTYFCRTVVTSVAGASNSARLIQRIEDVRTFAGQQVTVRFWAKADATKNISAELAQEFGSGGSPSAQINAIGVTKVSIGTSWQKVTVTATLPSISGKTLGTDNNSNTLLLIWFDAGSNFNSRTDSLGQQSGTFDIAQVQLEAGPVATPFERRPIGTELALCQRYYEVGEFFHVEGYFGSAGVNSGSSVFFAVGKRALPTITQTNIATSGAASATPQNTAIAFNGFLSFRSGASAASGQFHESWTASAEL